MHLEGIVSIGIRIIAEQVVGIWIIVSWGSIIVCLQQEGEIASFEHLLRKFVDPG